MKTYDARLMAEDVMTTEQVAEALHITTRTVYRWSESGKLHPVKVEGRLLYPRGEVVGLMQPDGAGRRPAARRRLLTEAEQAERIAEFINASGSRRTSASDAAAWLETLQEAGR